MIIDCISDLHGSYPELEGGDLLIVAGDLTARDIGDEYREFRDWLRKQDYKKKIVIAGNHDGWLEVCPAVFNEEWLGATYLCDKRAEFEGLKIWGSPWTPMFCNWHFMLERGSVELKAKWDLIPDDIDILITHGPSWGILDCPYEYPRNKLDHVGCHLLREAVERIKPKLHVFGHIHGGYGKVFLKHEGPYTICVNASHCNEEYKPVNNPIRVEL